MVAEDLRTAWKQARNNHVSARDAFWCAKRDVYKARATEFLVEQTQRGNERVKAYCSWESDMHNGIDVSFAAEELGVGLLRYELLRKDVHASAALECILRAESSPEKFFAQYIDERVHIMNHGPRRSSRTPLSNIFLRFSRNARFTLKPRLNISTGRYSEELWRREFELLREAGCLDRSVEHPLMAELLDNSMRPDTCRADVIDYLFLVAGTEAAYAQDVASLSNDQLRTILRPIDTNQGDNPELIDGLQEGLQAIAERALTDPLLHARTVRGPHLYLLGGFDNIQHEFPPATTRSLCVSLGSAIVRAIAVNYPLCRLRGAICTRVDRLEELRRDAVECERYRRAKRAEEQISGLQLVDYFASMLARRTFLKNRPPPNYSK